MNTQFLELFRLPEKVWGTPINPLPPIRLREKYENTFHIIGKTAIFFLVTDDLTITRKEAIAFATLMATGKAVLKEVSFSYWNDCQFLYGNNRTVKK